MVYKDTDDAVATSPATGRFSRHPLTGSYLDLIALIGLSIVTLAIVLTQYFEHSALRFALGIALVMFVPGYMFMAAAYPGKNDLGSLERFLLSVTFSVVLVPLVGFVFNFTTWGITFDTMIFTITAIIGVCSLVALFRRHRLPANKRFTMEIAQPLREILNFLAPSSKNRTDKLLSILLIGAILLTVSATAYAVMTLGARDKYTEFYICGPSGNLSNYPLSFNLGESKQVIAVITNHEGNDKAYSLVARMEGLGAADKEIYSDHFMLADNQTAERTINLTPDRAGNFMNAQFLLYVDGVTDQPYRSCNLWVNVTPPNAVLDTGSIASLTGINTTV